MITTDFLLDALPTGQDLESTEEMLPKVALTNIISKDPNIETDRFINYLNEFYYRSQSINQEYLNRIKYKKPIFPAEALTTLENFLLATNSHSRFNYQEQSFALDECLLGSNNWRNAPPTSMKPEIQLGKVGLLKSKIFTRTFMSAYFGPSHSLQLEARKAWGQICPPPFPGCYDAVSDLMHN